MYLSPKFLHYLFSNTLDGETLALTKNNINLNERTLTVIQTTLDTYASVFKKFNNEENENHDAYMKENKLLEIYCIAIALLYNH